ncbi:hypothetical protein J2Z62_000739 [Mycoplasmoides fastidiosum]|uniref:Uncharacterized protein n=1 Tax=Mycoplasmoides fastidiosum TaxID=92758 RepID=A0ABU0M013_9BACT|nr:hypothetical protein [Mycoplasmoides fastidiosum]MDQ0514301.1 hypothetical protein [Mycoplasmoides fastidiosum]UUD38095.1 hypothetical protein NPA10_01780 [Mycoplasmoides fastidiosum]
MIPNKSDSLEKQNRFVFIYNRFKTQQSGCKAASDILPNSKDFEIFYTSYEDLKNQMIPKVKTLLADLPKDLPYFKNKLLVDLWKLIDQISDHPSIEAFIVKCINCSGILLKGFSKIFFEGHEYIFLENQICKFRWKDRCFVPKLQDKHEVIWRRKVYISKERKMKSVRWRKIETFDDFYAYFGKPLKDEEED